jgi:hypothetical protein
MARDIEVTGQPEFGQMVHKNGFGTVRRSPRKSMRGYANNLGASDLIFAAFLL